MENIDPWGFDPRTSFKASVVLGAIFTGLVWVLFIHPIIPFQGSVRFLFVRLEGWFVNYASAIIVFGTWIKMCSQPAIPLNSQARLVFWGMQTRDVWGENALPIVPVPFLFWLAQPDSIEHFVIDVVAENRCVTRERMRLVLQVRCIPTNVYLTAKMTQESLSSQLHAVVQSFAQGIIIRSDRQELLQLQSRTHEQMLSECLAVNDFCGVQVKVLFSGATEVSTATQALYDLEAELPLQMEMLAKMKAAIGLSDTQLLAALQSRTGVVPTATTHVISEDVGQTGQGSHRGRRRVNLVIDNRDDR